MIEIQKRKIIEKKNYNQNVRYDLTKKMTAHTLCFRSLIKKAADV